MNAKLENKKVDGCTRSTADPFFRTRRLFQPFQIGPMNLKNRIAVAPFSRSGTRGDGVPTEEMAKHYQSFARGGFGLIITEGTYTDTVFSQAFAGQPGLVNHAQARGWETATQAVHVCGGRIVLQLMHAGALSQFLPVTCAPSSVRPLGSRLQGQGSAGPFPIPKTMTVEDINRTIGGFVQSSMRAEAVGFDGVEIQAGNGYLLDQFLSADTNRRDDDYGGEANARIHLTARIIEEIRACTSPNFFIGVRLSQAKVNDPDHRWPGGAEEAEGLFMSLAQAGADAIHFASNGYGFEKTCFTDDGLSLPALAHRKTGLPVILNGGMHDPVFAASVLAEGHGNLISIGRGAIANSDWPDRVRVGRPLNPPIGEHPPGSHTADVIPLAPHDRSSLPVRTENQDFKTTRRT